MPVIGGLNPAQQAEEEDEEDHDGRPPVTDSSATSTSSEAPGAMKSHTGKGTVGPKQKDPEARDLKSLGRKGRDALANFVDWVSYSENVLYAFKFTFGVMLVSWPAFLQEYAQWYVNIRGGRAIYHNLI